MRTFVKCKGINIVRSTGYAVGHGSVNTSIGLALAEVSHIAPAPNAPVQGAYGNKKRAGTCSMCGEHLEDLQYQDYSYDEVNKSKHNSPRIMCRDCYLDDIENYQNVIDIEVYREGEV